MKQISLKRTKGKIRGELSLSGSKSISNRLLIMDSLSGNHGHFENLSVSADTRSLQFHLDLIASCASSSIPMVINTENAGTVLRFLSAYLAITNGRWLLTGNERMKKRPMEGLTSALRELGAEVVHPEKESYPPLHIVGRNITGGKVTVDASASSQFVTALMLIAPCLEKGLQLEFVKKPVSFSYIVMTQRLMQEFGAELQLWKNRVEIKPGSYRMKPFRVEPDWSSASYWYELAALAEDAMIFLRGFSRQSVQGDSVVVKVFEQLGVQTIFEENGISLKSTGSSAPSFTYDFASCPDLVPAVLATCAIKRIPAVLKGVGHLKFKESDRIAALKMELLKTGTCLNRQADSVELIPSNEDFAQTDCVFDTHGDHRLAMALAPLALRLASVKINKPEVVSKSYPPFWDDLAKLGLQAEEN
ncbi:MAG: 3-phosphoshikimate 1-carboxyvinyltransferase [Bacteroidales bacterium]|nr:3-phosphoshikimate 1-carboxyvinyltransferase [Bacteroidales bacterium]